MHRVDKLRNLKRLIPCTGEFVHVIVAKFGDHKLHRLASSLSKVIRQVYRQADENSSLSDFFRTQYLVFSCFKCYIQFCCRSS